MNRKDELIQHVNSCALPLHQQCALAWRIVKRIGPLFDGTSQPDMLAKCLENLFNRSNRLSEQSVNVPDDMFEVSYKASSNEFAIMLSCAIRSILAGTRIGIDHRESFCQCIELSFQAIEQSHQLDFHNLEVPTVPEFFYQIAHDLETICTLSADVAIDPSEAGPLGPISSRVFHPGNVCVCNDPAESNMEIPLSIQEVRLRIEFLRTIRLRGETSIPQSIHEAIGSLLKPLLFLPQRFNGISSIYRARSGRITNLSELTAPPPTSVSKWGRCNEPGESMFYCATSPVIAINEVVHAGSDFVTVIHRSKTEECDGPTLQCFAKESLWRSINAELSPRLFVNSDLEKYTLIDEFFELLFTRIVPSGEDLAIDYALSAVLTSQCLKDTRWNYDGIVYPPLKNDGIGLNMAMRPEKAESIYTDIRGIDVFQLTTLNGFRSACRVEKSFSINPATGQIEYKPHSN